MITVTRRDRIVELRLDRPPVNAFDETMIGALNNALDGLADARDFQVLHVRGAADVFAAGADLSMIHSWRGAPSLGVELDTYLGRLQRLFDRIESLAQVTVCEIAGAALGAGFELALSCDLRICADDAIIGLPEVGLGLIPAAGGTQRLTRLCGRGVAARVIILGEPVDGATAASLGMVEWSVPREVLAERAKSLVDRLASLPAQAQQAAKHCIQCFGEQGTPGFRLERDLAASLMDSPQTQQRIRQFLARRAQR